MSNMEALPKQVITVYLQHKVGYSDAEIATSLKLHKSTVLSYIRRAKSHFENANAKALEKARMRAIKVFDMHKEGLSFREIGDFLKISPNRVMQLSHKGEKILKRAFYQSPNPNSTRSGTYHRWVHFSLESPDDPIIEGSNFMHYYNLESEQ